MGWIIGQQDPFISHSCLSIDGLYFSFALFSFHNNGRESGASGSNL
jgi:hypothetical protein